MEYRPSPLEAMIKETFPELQHHASTSASRPSLPACDSSQTDVPTLQTPSMSPVKSRSFSDTTPKLAPSPKIKENLRGLDDHAVAAHLTTPSRQPGPLGLSLCMPSKDFSASSLFNRTVTQSPKVEARSLYASSTSVLPRRSRGMDFSRAATHLHHSTLAEPSPDSSPTITQKGMMIPGRTQSVNAMVVDPPSWGGAFERSTVSSSLGSVNMFASEDSSSDDEGEPVDPDEQEDQILSTPNLNRKSFSNVPGSISAHWGHNFFSPNAQSFLHYRRKVNDHKSRKSSSSASGHVSPAPASPALGKGGELSYFPREINMLQSTKARRESLSLGTTELHISSGNDSGDEGNAGPSTPGVIRRAVTRRGNLLPKTRAFGRIKAELIEESAPVDTEVKREAMVVRQVRESDTPTVPLASTTPSSPSMKPASSLEGNSEHAETGSITLDDSCSSNPLSSGKGLFAAFTSTNRNGEFWDKFEQKVTPPPNLAHATSSGDDIVMDSPVMAAFSQYPMDAPIGLPSRSHSRSSTPQPISGQGPSAAQGLRKNNKRRRDDDFDTASLKRRAVSPGLSVSNSPILSQSPAQRGDFWGNTHLPPPKVSREASVITSSSSGGGRAVGERSNSVSSVVMGTPSTGPKRIGLQGMTDMQGLAEKMTLE